jgi:cell division protease FtsH
MTMITPTRAAIGLLIAIFFGVVLINLAAISNRVPEQSYSTFLFELADGDIASVHIKGGEIVYTDQSNREFTTFAPDVGALLPQLEQAGVEISTEKQRELVGLSRDLLIVLVLLGGWLIFTAGKNNTSTRFARTKQLSQRCDTCPAVSFDDVAGISEAREELKELTDFLRTPQRYEKLGGRIPHGVLLEGPPGTGKTLLAKAIAGEASVPFYHLSGSDFVEMFAGLGASRVRELFAEAKKHAPCIIFIDEIDAIGGARSGGPRSGTNDEREQTLNALLVEMDGFGSEATVIVMAATNRPDILDSALLRPGRFDRRISLTLPDVKERLKILAVHGARVTIAAQLDLSVIAQATPGFSGAELANLVNEAALLAARKNHSAVELADFEEAKDKIIMGIARKTAVVSEKTRRLTAYHEAGHAVIAALLPDADPLHKVTIIPRGHSVGQTTQIALDDQLTFSGEYLMDRITILMGGRQAEELIFGQQSSGASNDIKRATAIAARLVCEFGMSERIGPIYCGTPFDTETHDQQCMMQSEQTRREIDHEIRRIITQCASVAGKLMQEHDLFVHMLAEALLIHETLDRDEIDIIYRCYLNRIGTEQNTMKSHHHERIAA